MDRRIDPKLSGLKTGELLVIEGFVSQEEIKIALKIQQQEKALRPLPLGIILVQKGLISKEDLNHLLKHPALRKNIGEMAIEKGLMDADQLATCLRGKGPHEHINKVLVRKGHVSPDDLDALRRRQLAGKKLGQLALSENLISRNDLEKALSIKNSQRPIGEILCDLGLINPSELNYVLHKYDKHLKLGEILIKQGIIDTEKLDAALEVQRRENDFLGRLLVKKRLITADQLYSALARQYNIPFRKLEGDFWANSPKKSLLGIISKTYAAKNQILCLSLEENRLTLAVTVPEKSLCLQELRSVYTHLQMTCVLITEEKFNALFRMLYEENPPPLRTAANKPDQGVISDIRKLNIEAPDISASPSASPDNTAGNVATEEAFSLDGNMVISDPDTERWKIDKMFTRYQALNEKLGRVAGSADFAVFKEFIMDIYDTVSDRFQSSHVSYSFKVSNEMVEVVATPEN